MNIRWRAQEGTSQTWAKADRAYRWQADQVDSLRAPRLSNTASGRSALTHSMTAEDSSAAWKHVKIVVKDDGKPVDLHTLLTHSVRETQYSLQPAGVRFPISVLSTMTDRRLYHASYISCAEAHVSMDRHVQGMKGRSSISPAARKAA